MEIKMNELKWLAERAHDLYKDGMLGFYGHEDMPTVHMNRDAFFGLFGNKSVYIVPLSDDTDKMTYYEDGVRFFCLVNKGEWDEEDIDA